MVLKKPYFIVWLCSFLYFCWGMSHFGLVLGADEWGILYSSRQILEGQISGDPNKTISIIMGLITVSFNEPWVFPIISSLFGAGSCLGVYRIIESFTGNRSVPFLGWIVVLNSPMLLWLVLSCNSIFFMTFFLIWALHYLNSENYLKGYLMLSLASIARPEPILIGMFFSCFMVWRGWVGKLPWKSVLTFIFILGIPPLWWMGFNEMAYGRLFYSLEQVHQYGQTWNATMELGNFLTQFWEILHAYYLSDLAVVFSMFGMIFLFAERKKLYFIYSFLFVGFFGLWFFVNFKFALIERFLLPLFIYLMIFGAILFDRLLGKLKGLSSNASLKNVFVASIFLVFFLVNLPSQASSRILGFFYKNTIFDRDLPKVVELLKRELALANPVTVLASARRIQFLSYHLYHERDKISFISFREVYLNRTDWNQSGVDYVVLAPKDLFPPQSLLYNVELLTPEGLTRQGLEIAKHLKVSPLTSFIKLVPELDDLRDD
jgi:hypothetical protein